MVLRLLCMACLFPVLLSGCASLATVERSDEQDSKDEVAVATNPVPQETIHDPLSVKSCLRTERDLTVAWHAKRYLCTHEIRRVALQQVNDGEFAAFEYSIQPLAKKQSVAENAFIIPAVATAPVVDDKMVQYASLPSVDVSRHQALKSDDTQIFRVWFPGNHEVLGQQGIEKALAMIPAVTDARHVTLLGVYEDSEIPDTTSLSHEQERFSVGRALSVKKIWSRNGVDLSKVKILHHQNHLSGRYVEVTFND